EMNTNGWWAWSGNLLTAAQYISTWQTMWTQFKNVDARFKFHWCPNAQGTSSGNLPSGRTNTDTFPGAAYVDYVGVDVYDCNGAVGNSISDIQLILTWNQTGGGPNAPFIIGEYGLSTSASTNGGNDDDTAFITDIANLVKTPANNFHGHVYFSCPSSECPNIISGPFGGGSNIFPNSLSVYLSQYAGE